MQCIDVLVILICDWFLLGWYYKSQKSCIFSLNFIDNPVASSSNSVSSLSSLIYSVGHHNWLSKSLKMENPNLGTPARPPRTLPPQDPPLADFYPSLNVSKPRGLVKALGILVWMFTYVEWVIWLRQVVWVVKWSSTLPRKLWVKCVCVCVCVSVCPCVWACVWAVVWLSVWEFCLRGRVSRSVWVSVSLWALCLF